ncbi:MAG TPA: DUF4384 domain-containing protein [Stellaceae bacterium]|nr:DUF4384 domain-containing protein [Stellaceae bacterium]
MRKLHPLVAAACLALSTGELQSCTGFGGLKRLPDAQAVIADMRFPGSPLTIEAAADRPDGAYRAGEKIRLSVRLDKPAYLAVLEVRKSGETRLLFPNKAHPGAFEPANVVVSIPGPRDAFVILAPRPGTVLLEVVASTSGASWLFQRTPAGSSTFAELGATTRLLAKEIASALKHNGGAAAAAVVMIHVATD